jgi:signal peptidase
MRVFRAIQTIALTLMAIFGAASVAAVAVGLAMDLKPVVVISGSMEPTLPVGSLVLGRTVPASELASGDVVSVPRPADHSLVTHRIVSVTPSTDGVSLVLKGDSNMQNDPDAYQVYEADLVVAHVPHAGAALSWLRTHSLVALVVLGALLALTLWPVSPTFRVELPDGSVRRNLSKREADQLLAELCEAKNSTPARAETSEGTSDLDEIVVARRSLEDNS